MPVQAAASAGFLPVPPADIRPQPEQKAHLPHSVSIPLLLCGDYANRKYVSTGWLICRSLIKPAYTKLICRKKRTSRLTGKTMQATNRCDEATPAANLLQVAFSPALF